MRRLPPFGLALFLLYVALAPACVAASAPRKTGEVEGIAAYELDNGLQLLLFPDASRPTVTVNITYLVGSRHEGAGEGGMAHLLEHMLFKGTPDRPDIPRLLNDRGARYNGSTSVDRTNYFETLPASDENLRFALELEADRMVNSYVRQEDLDSEMTVVRNEFERGENSPFAVLRQRIYSVAYDWHPYGRATIGNRSDIERVPIDRLRAFYRKYYQPDNALLVIAGRFDPDKALRWTQELFGAIPRPDRVLEAPYTAEPPKDGERLVVLRRVGEIGLAGAAYHIPAGPHPDFASLRVLEHILGDEPSGRLYKALVETKKATAVYAAADAWHDPGLLLAMAVTQRDGDLEDVRRTLVGEVERIGREGVRAEEVERARREILKQRELSLDDTSRVAVELSEWAAQGDWRLYFLYRDRIEAVSPESVQQAAAAYLARNNRTVGLFVPTDEPQQAAVPQTPDVERMVRDYRGREAAAAGEPFDVSPANMEARTTRVKLPSGLDAALLPKKTRGEAVHLALLLRYGTADNLRGLATAADVLPELLTRGTQRLSRQELEDRLDRRRASLSASGRAGTVILRVQTKRPELPAVIELVKQILREPSLPADELEIIRREQLAALEHARTQPEALAGNFIDRALSPYPPEDVRYEPTLEEQIARLQQLRLETVRRLYEDYLGGQHGQLAVVGDFDPDAVTPLLADLLAGWTAKRPQARIERAVDARSPGRRRVFRTPGMANAAYRAGLGAPLSDAHPDYAPLLAANHIFGGSSLSSRLGDRVRQQEGLSYGVGSHFFARVLDPHAELLIFAMANPANMEKLAEIIEQELERLVRDGVTDEELERARQAMLQQRRLARTNDGRLAMELAATLYAGRTFQFEADLDRRIQRLTADEVNRALRKHVDLKRLFVAMAGDFPDAP